MSKNNYSRLMLALSLLLCACDNDPLVFSSGQTAGIKIKVSPNEGSPVSLTVGYDSVDAAIIPTTMDPRRQRIGSDRSRPVINKVEAVKNTEALLSEADAQSSQRARDAFSRAKATLEAQPGLGGAPDLVDVPLSVQRDVAEGVSALSPGSVEWVRAKEFQAKVGQPSDSQEDSLSVISTFNLDARADAQAKGAGAALGKTFATGIAAQYIGQGLGQSLNASAVSECLKEANQMKDGAREAAAAACGR